MDIENEIQTLKDRLAEIDDRTLAISGIVGGLVDRAHELPQRLDQRFEVLTRLAAFFGPMLANKTPPLDGAEVADKAYVDDGLARFSGAFRAEVFAKIQQLEARLDRPGRLSTLLQAVAFAITGRRAAR